MHYWQHDGWGPDQYGPGGHEWLPLFFMGMSLLWIVAPIAFTTLYLWWRGRRARPLLAAGGEGAPSAFEQLRRRYVVGEIDVATFEEMTGRLLISEHLEETAERRPPLLADYEAYQAFPRGERPGDEEPAIWI